MNVISKNFSLRPYQQTILDELSLERSIGLFMGTGSGKTLTALERVKDNPTSKLLVVCPQSVIRQWESVINTHFDGFKVLQTKKSFSSEKINKLLITEDYNTVIINFEKLHRLPNLMKVVDRSWTIIIDESHRIKAYGTVRKPVLVTRAALKLGEKVDYKIILTATPTQGQFGGYVDYYPQLKFIDALDQSFQEYYETHVIEKRINYGNSPYPVAKIVGYKYTPRIDDILKQTCRRYVPKFHDADPEHIKIMLPKTPSYDRILREFAYEKIMLSNAARKRIGMKTLTTGTIMGHDMLGNDYTYEDNKTKIEWLEDFINDTDEVISIFYQYNVELESLKKLMKKLGKKFIIINGKTKDKYAELKKDFDVVLGQFQAMSESLDGLHLKSHIEIFFAMPESSLTYKQAIGRIDRDGQTKLPIYYYLIMEDTVEEDIYNMIEKKIEFSDITLDKLIIGGNENGIDA
jgi:SNF2 family DNA or RNA helicase